MNRGLLNRSAPPTKWGRWLSPRGAPVWRKRVGPWVVMVVVAVVVADVTVAGAVVVAAAVVVAV